MLVTNTPTLRAAAPQPKAPQNQPPQPPEDHLHLSERAYAGGNGAFIMTIPSAIGAAGRLFGSVGQAAGVAVGTAATVGLMIEVAHISDGHAEPKILAGLGLAAAASAAAGAYGGWPGVLGAAAVGFVAGASLQ